MRLNRVNGLILVPVAVGLAAVAAAGASGHGDQGRISFTPHCVARELSVKMTHIPGSNGAGHTGYLLTVHNRGRKCSLGTGYPELTLLEADGKKLPTRVKRVHRGARHVAAGGSLSAHLRFSPDVPGPGEPQTGVCEPVAHKIAVHLPIKDGTVVGEIEPPTSVCEHGTIEEGILS